MGWGCWALRPPPLTSRHLARERLGTNVPAEMIFRKMKSTTSRRVQVELPSEAFPHHQREPNELSRELRELWLLEQVRQRRLAFTKAAELAGIPLALFLERMRAHKITPFDLAPDELVQELQ